MLLKHHLEEVRAAGYAGGCSQFRDYVRPRRPRQAMEVVQRFKTEPGKQVQVDFAEFRFPWGQRYALLAVLRCSRLLWLKFYERQDMRTLVSGLGEAFVYFGGVARELLFDQMKAVITRDERLHKGQLVKNAEFQRFAAHWGFVARACRPYRAKTKGKVERRIRYVRSNFVYGRDFLNDADLDEQRARWLEKANDPVHGTTKRGASGAALSVARAGTAGAAGAPAARAAADPGGAQAPFGLRRPGRRCPVKPGTSRRDRLRGMLADLKMPGSLEALDTILQGVYGGAISAPEALERFCQHRSSFATTAGCRRRCAPPVCRRSSC